MKERPTAQKLLNELNIMIKLLVDCLHNCRAVHRELTHQLKLKHKRNKS